ncbi:MAG TPA: pectin acetylesterase-family hydrolase [Anaeromyxobacter sp.]
MRPLLRSLSVACIVALAACGGSEPQQQPALQQGWNDVAGMLCADGSPTGIGVQFGTRNSVIVVLSGGGACWDATHCGATVPRSFGSADFAFYSLFTAGTIFDRSLPGNPFTDWTFVFVPYCTGDVHAGGDVTMTYGAAGTWRHHGRKNLEAAIATVAAAIPSPDKVVVSGSSAGGFGALLAFDIARAKWPAGATGPKAYLVDDSGQTFVGNDLPQSLRDTWWASWALDRTITPLCAICNTDLSQLWTVLHTAHPSDRLALLSSTQDSTMIGFFSPMTPTEFATGVTHLAQKLQTIPNAASFRVAGSGHAFLLAPGSYTAAGTPLLTWLGLEVSDSTSWTSVGP